MAFSLHAPFILTVMPFRWLQRIPAGENRLGCNSRLHCLRRWTALGRPP